MIDGDTLVAEGLKYRFFGVDTPETFRPDCLAEEMAGKAATRLVRHLAGSTVKVCPVIADDYGRTVARVLWRGDDGAWIDFRHTMIQAYKAVHGLTVGLEAKGVTTHGLRYTAATILSELGFEWGIIASITGHDTAQMVKRYTSRRRKAQIAIARLDSARRGTKEGS